MRLDPVTLHSRRSLHNVGSLVLWLLIGTPDVARAQPAPGLMDFRILRKGEGPSTPIKVTTFHIDGSPAPDARLWLAGCPLGRRTTTELAENQTLIWATTPGTCTLSAYRSDGLARAWSDDVTLVLAVGDAPAVALRLPAEAYGGPGFTTDHDSNCFEVRGLVKKSAAYEAGIRDGDCLSKVGGMDVRGLKFFAVGAVERALFGPIGSTVEVTVTKTSGDITGQFPRTELTP